MTFRAIASVCATLGLFGCGSILGPPDGGSDAADVESDGGGADTGWTTCTSPAHYAVCQGTNQCSPSDCACEDVIDGVGICSSDKRPYPYGLGCPAVDGRICLQTSLTSPAPWVDTAYELGVLIAGSGGANRVRYADMGLWTGDPIPNPQTCPDLGGTQACGGACGACPAGLTCRGRSPLHPAGFCEAGYERCGTTSLCPNSGTSCFTFTVQASAQAEADAWGLCLPTAQCNALVATLPGGGKCI